MYFNLQICNVIKKKYDTSTKPPKGCLPAEMNKSQTTSFKMLWRVVMLKEPFTQKKKKFCYHVLFVLTAGHYNLMLYEKELHKVYSKCLALA